MPHRCFAREEWAALRAATPLTLDEGDLVELQGINEELDLHEVVEIYLPLSRLLNLRVAAAQQLARVTDTFLGTPPAKVPFVIGLAGSVAVGKSTTARILQALLRRWPDHPRVELVTTDGFLHPNAVLEARGIMNRKGFPESYDVRRLVRFMGDLKAGVAEVAAPVYSHEAYDVVPGATQVVAGADVVIVEGVNVLQVESPVSVSDHFDFAVYVDADEADIRQWYLDRFAVLRAPMFAGMGEEQLMGIARSVWEEVNLRNLVDNILPTRERADVVLHKGSDHRVAEVLLRG